MMVIAALVGCLCYSLYTFKHWKRPDTFTYYLSRDLTEALVEQGLFDTDINTADPLLNARKIVITTGMNEKAVHAVVERLLYLDQQDSQKPINLYISSQGGWYNAVFSIIDTFALLKAPVNTICIGGCYSSSALLLAAGTGKRYASPNARVSLHIEYGGQGDDDVPFSKSPERINKTLQTITTLPKDWFPLEDDRHYYLSAEQALEYHIVDEIIPASHQPDAAHTESLKPSAAAN